MPLLPSIKPEKRKKLLYGLGMFAVVTLIVLGVFARNGWLPRTDSVTGRQTGWFGRELSAASVTQPPTAPLPGGTPQLSKEYIYAGSRLIAVADANAVEAPPADLAVWRPSTGTWYVLGGLGSQQVNVNWGMAGDLPIPADFDGDGKTDFSIYRPSNGTWWIQRSSDNQTTVISFGAPCEMESKKCDRAIPADFDGDGKSDYVVYQSVDRLWHIIRSSDGGVSVAQWGNGGDLPYPADFDGDGKADYCVWRPGNGTFYSINSSNGIPLTVTVGQIGDRPVPADYDGDGKADHAVWRPSTGNWYVRQSSDNQYLPAFQYGQSGDTPVPNDYDADGKCDKAVWRPPVNVDSKNYGVWWIQRSSAGQWIVGWGIYGDIPVPAFYRR